MNQIYWTDERLWDWLWLNIQVCPDSNHLAGNCCRRTRDINFWGSIYWITRVSLAMISIIVLWFIYLFNYFFRFCILWFGEGGAFIGSEANDAYFLHYQVPLNLEAYIVKWLKYSKIFSRSAPSTSSVCNSILWKFQFSITKIVILRNKVLNNCPNIITHFLRLSINFLKTMTK